MANNLLFIDTSAFYSFFDKNDKNYENISKSLSSREEAFVTSNYIIDELITLFRVRKFDVSQFEHFIEAIWEEKICSLIRVTPEIESEA
ncbi:MAG: hypothetical protein OEZ13_05595 [Spirochaetia bacterium]|nr:hypothetical protein [Spirochaetia bacterium]